MALGTEWRQAVGARNLQDSRSGQGSWQDLVKAGIESCKARGSDKLGFIIAAPFEERAADQFRDWCDAEDLKVFFNLKRDGSLDVTVTC